MKKLLSLSMLILALALVGCGRFAPGARPTFTEVELQTQIASVLTTMPTTTNDPKGVEVTNTPMLATATPVLAEATAASTATPGPAVVTATQAPVVATATQVPATATQTLAAPQSSATPTATPGGPTPTPSQDDPRTRLGQPSSTDSMDNASEWVWPTASNEFSSVQFKDGTLALTGLTQKLGWRLANPTGTDFKDLYLEMTVKTGNCTSNDQYGVIVRVPDIKAADQGYLFGVTCDGRYSLLLWNGRIGKDGEMAVLKTWTSSKAIQAGSDKTNRLGLMMVGNRLIMYANGTLLGEAQDKSFSAGNFGVFIGAPQTTNFTIQIDSMSYWLNPKP